MTLNLVFCLPPAGYLAGTYYVFETMTLCRLSLGLGPLAYEHWVPALTQ